MYLKRKEKSFKFAAHISPLLNLYYLVKGLVFVLFVGDKQGQCHFLSRVKHVEK